MAKEGQVVARRMTLGQPEHVRHIAYLKWATRQGGLEWSSRDVMVDKVSRSPRDTFFVEGGGTTAGLYVVSEHGSSWVQTEPDHTKKDNLLWLPEE